MTHRPRPFAQLSPEALRSLASPSRPDSEPSASAAQRNGERDLRPFADQLVAIAEQLRSADFAHYRSGPPTSVPAAPYRARAVHLHTARNNNAADPSDLNALNPAERRQAFAEMARAAYAKRRKRTTIFGDPELFGEPAWDILLDLYIAQVEEKSVSVSSACIGSASPPTTGLRWLGVLADQGLLEREHDPQDQRRVLVRLTEKALDMMDDYFAGSAGFVIDRRAASA